MNGRTRHISIAAGLALAFALTQFPVLRAEAAPMEFKIESQPLAGALNAWSGQSGIQVFWPAGSTASEQSAPVFGRLEPLEALRQLLDRTGLSFSLLSQGRIVAIHGASRKQAQNAGSQAIVAAHPIKWMAASTNSVSAESSPDFQSDSPFPSKPAPSADNETFEMTEVVVTGSHIRGVENTPSPMITLTRDEIEKSGFGNVSQLIASLPQNFAAGASQNVNANVSRGGSENNQSLGSGINLRGLGTGGTLTLLNGHRLAPSGEGTFVDISLIPLSAIERIEVLPDGASAIYGSDAIGGVVNVITRNDFQGSETRVRYGSVTNGDREEYLLGQMFGGVWESGNIVLNLEHETETALDAADRSFAGAVGNPTDLLPEQKTNSAFVALQQEVTDSVKVSADVIASRREYDQMLNFFNIVTGHQEGRATGFASSATVSADFGSSWRGEALGSYARSDEKLNYERPNDPSFGPLDIDHKAHTWTAEGRLEGRAFAMPGGDVRIALGIAYRDEGAVIGSSSDTDPIAYRSNRTVRSAYAELLVPLVGAANSFAGVQRLDLTLAGRADDYSDFGDTANPKFGVVWSLAKGLTLRGTYGKSFKAPGFRQLNTTGAEYGYVFDVSDPASVRPDGLTTAILLDGGNADLKPERSRSWTAGISINPTFAPALRADLNYFEINYEDQIVLLISDNFATFLEDEPVLASFIQRNPSEGFIRSLVGGLPAGVDDFNQNVFGITDPDALLAQYTIGAYFDGRYNNVAESNVRGVDLQLAYAWSLENSTLDVGLNGTYLMDYSQRPSAVAQAVEFVSTVYHPIDLRLRGNVTFTYGGWSATTFLNYTDNYTDPGTVYSLGGTVSSWTTVDLQLSYQPSGLNGTWWSGMTIALSALNAFDEPPPAINAGPFQLGYDAENASPLGRFIALSAVKRW
jgi:iron complex outermembrane recepter protein